jgi:hypothetical protein
MPTPIIHFKEILTKFIFPKTKSSKETDQFTEEKKTTLLQNIIPWVFLVWFGLVFCGDRV